MSAPDHVASADGTPIAFETFGQGPPLIAVCGATCDRALMRATAKALGDHFTVVNYDRRGRGDSGDTLPYSVEREIEDIAALLGEVGAPAQLYGHSSGAGLALRAVGAGLPVERFVLHDPPYSPDDEASQAEARTFAQGLRDLLAEDRHADAIDTFFLGTGMPDEALDGMRDTPMWAGLIALAHTLDYDSAVMDAIESGSAIPEELASRVKQPGLVLAGGDSPAFMLEVSRRLAELLPQGSHRILEGQSHAAAPEVVAPVIAEFARE